MRNVHHLGIFDTLGFAPPEGIAAEEAFVSYMRLSGQTSLIVVMGGRAVMFDVVPDGLELQNSALEQSRRAVSIAIGQVSTAAGPRVGH